jgi:hypothetical protein
VSVAGEPNGAKSCGIATLMTFAFRMSSRAPARAAEAADSVKMPKKRHGLRGMQAS